MLVKVLEFNRITYDGKMCKPGDLIDVAEELVAPYVEAGLVKELEVKEEKTPRRGAK